ncbi:unnamed protein product [Thlaspi arvense]|uniref:Replication protein A subunit n=1 Tax=Thlaspi arvense TaxID=13288 RepID=A0AAU9RNB2_THLAR|nr:unnamed protein product [Thlaspi arvense]
MIVPFNVTETGKFRGKSLITSACEFTSPSKRYSISGVSLETMAVNLMAGAITKMLAGEVTSEKELTPILQVTELTLIQPRRQNRDRYKLSLADGIQSQEGMINASLNYLVIQGNIQVGSILRLTHFVSNCIQYRRLILIVELEIIAEKCNIIGNHVPPIQRAKPDDPDQQRGEVSSVNTQCMGGFEQNQARRSQLNGVVADSPQPQFGHRQAFGTASVFPETPSSTRSYVSSNAGYDLTETPSSTISYVSSNAGSGFPETPSSTRPYVSSNAGSGFTETSPSTRPYVSSNASYGGSRHEQPRAPETAYCPVQSVSQPQPPPLYVNTRPVAKNNEAPLRVVPIAALNPYLDRWTIKVRVTSKGELMRFSSTHGDGKVFSFDLVNADGGEIRVTCFNDVVDQFFDLIVLGNVYLISKGSLKPARKEYNHLPHDFEIHLDSVSTVQQCYEDDATIPRNRFHFRSIGDIESMESNSITDLIGIVLSISPSGSVMRKNGTEAQKRALLLKDMSGRSVEVIMWGGFCNTKGHKLQNLYDSGVFPILALKACRISEFNGKQVSTIGSSQFFIEPDFPEARELREWYEREGRNAPCVSISREFLGVSRQEVRKVITQIKDEKLGTSEKPDWITVSATISFIKGDSFCYTACPIMNGDRPCSKKVTNNGDGIWRCERCDRCVDECDYVYMLQLQLQD